MDKILDSKGIITDELNNIIEYCQELKSIYENNHTEMTKELNHINAFNKRLTQELKDKEKQLNCFSNVCTHRGNILKEGSKYIITGWINFC